MIFRAKVARPGQSFNIEITKLPKVGLNRIKKRSNRFIAPVAFKGGLAL